MVGLKNKKYVALSIRGPIKLDNFTRNTRENLLILSVSMSIKQKFRNY